MTQPHVPLADGYHAVPPGKLAAVITDLEMSQPRLRGATLPDGVRFVQIDPDVPAYRDLFERVGRDWLWYGRRVLPDAALDAILRDPQVHIYTLEVAGQAEAILELDFRTARACELAYFGLTPALIGSGAGAYLMDQAVSRAFAADIDRFHLHTCTLDSPQALGFYMRTGFVPMRQRVEVFDDPRLTHGYDPALAPHVPLRTPPAASA